ncbi:MAG: sugar ABC transporter permease [Deinococcus sp.]|nr:sugar ABC transporter permease [Deinococcus sp.]
MAKRGYSLPRQQNRLAYAFLATTLLFYATFLIYPLGLSIFVSMRSWNLLTPLSRTRFVGLDNFKYIFTRDEIFQLAMKNSVIYALATVFLSVAISLMLALALQRARYAAVWRVVFFLPVVTSSVAIAQVWVDFYHPTYGFANQVLRFLGLPGQKWISSPDQALGSVIAVAVWSSLGFTLIILSAGLKNIPQVYYDAARIDGAGTWQEFWHITLPLLRPTLLFVTVTGMIGAWQAFDLPLVMTAGGPVNRTMTVLLRAYETAFTDLRMGRATAMAFVLFGIILVITLIQLRIFRRGGVESY